MEIKQFLDKFKTDNHVVIFLKIITTNHGNI